MRKPWMAASLYAIAALMLAPHLPGGSASAAKPAYIATKTFTLKQANESPRLVVVCPRKKFPYGGGMTSSPPPDSLGEGVYPHSYERLGVQGGWHVTPVLFDPVPVSTQPRTVTLQVVCGPKPKNMSPPHKTTMVSPGETETHLVECPGVRQLIGGGFQRAYFTALGGEFITESRAASDTAWRVTGQGFGAHGAQLTGIAYCKRSKKDLMTEVSGSTTIPPAGVGSATTPSCPGNLTLAFGGFDTEPTGSILISNGGFNEDGSWSGSGFNRSALPATMTVHGYCLNMRAVGKRKK